MDLAPLFRILSIGALAGSVVSLMLGNGVFAQGVENAVTPRARPAIARATPRPELPLAPAGSSDTALNWAGYTSSDGTYTSVSGSWIVPTVNDGGAGTLADATWVGIGGVISDDLIQAGTEAIPSANGPLAYRAWMEMLPDDSKIVPLQISPGDAVSVSITEGSPGVWDVSFDNASTGQTYATTVRYDSSLSSAEWIEEMPVEVGGVVGLDDFGSIDFTAGYAIKNGQPVTIRTSGASPLTMNNHAGVAVAQPSQLDQSGSSFRVTRTGAPSTPLALTDDGVDAVSIDPAPYSYEPLGPSEAAGYGHHGGQSGWGVYRIFIEF